MTLGAACPTTRHVLTLALTVQISEGARWDLPSLLFVAQSQLPLLWFYCKCQQLVLFF